MVNVTFHVNCSSTSWGQCVAVTGSFNGWDGFKKLATTPNDFPKWTATIEIPHGMQQVHFKYVIYQSESNHISKWEVDGTKQNRLLHLGNRTNISTPTHTFGHLPSSSVPAVGQRREFVVMQGGDETYDENYEGLNDIQKGMVKISNEQKSWRQRLQYVQSILSENVSMFDLGSMCIYLTWISNGHIKCSEDGGHHRPNHHAHTSLVINQTLHSLIVSNATNSIVGYIVRKMMPLLPSYGKRFMVSVPLTRIRDIAHRGDIPKDLKLHIKHNLQNKLHRCAGPEDLHTSEQILHRINAGDASYSEDFVREFNIFHEELKDFFNMSNLDDRLQSFNDADGLKLKDMKHNNENHFHQIKQLVIVRKKLFKILYDSPSDIDDENLQKVRLLDIQVENYGFILFASIAQQIENDNNITATKMKYINILGYCIDNLWLSNIFKQESQAISYDMHTFSNISTTSLKVWYSCIERVMRLTKSISDEIIKNYDENARTLGNAFKIHDNHVYEVYAESEIRSTLNFQISRITQSLSTHLRAELQLCEWDVLNTGNVVADRIVYIDNLGDWEGVTSKDEKVVIVCESAQGDEDVDESLGIIGVICGRRLPHLSHLGLRIRQADILFVACDKDNTSFQTVWNERLNVTDRSVVQFIVSVDNGVEKLQCIAKKTSSVVVVKDTVVEEKEQVNNKMSIDETYMKVEDVMNGTMERVSGKAYMTSILMNISSKSNDLFKVPKSITIPHGQFQKQIQMFKSEYYSLMRCEPRVNASIIRQFITDNFKSSDQQIIQPIQRAFPNENIIIRSSANAEDTSNSAGAGLFDSIANIDSSDPVQLSNAITQVWASVFTDRASVISFNGNVSMAVLVQQMIVPTLSFVAFSYDPLSTSQQCMYVEFAVGSGETLASARTDGSPYRFRVSRTRDDDVDVLAMANYSTGIAGNGHDQVVKYADEKMTVDEKWMLRVVNKVKTIVLCIERELSDVPQDVEGCVLDRAGDVDVCIVQTRPQIRRCS